ncbi:MAG: AI-2E family transporter [Bacillota bacterium]
MNKFWSGAYRFVLLLFIIAGAVWVLKSIAWVISLLIVSTLVVYTCYPLLLYLKRRFRIPHGAAVGVVFVAFLLVCLLAIGLLIPIIYYELVEIAEEITANYPLYVSNIEGYLEWVSAQLLHLDLEEEFRDYLMGFSGRLDQALEYIVDATLALAMGAVDMFFVLFLVLFLLYDFDAVRKQLTELFPVAHRSLAFKIISIVDHNVGSFIRGSLLRCTVVGLVTGITLYIIGMPYALLLGILAGLFNFILYIGPFIAAVPAILLSFASHTPAPLLILAVYVIIQILDGVLLAPLLLGRVVKLRPVTIIVSILAGGRLAGVLGMLIAVPVAGIIKGLLELLKESPQYADPVNQGERSSTGEKLA